MKDNDIQVLPWPAVSPDINCIENLWAIIGRTLRTKLPRPTNGDGTISFSTNNMEWNIRGNSDHTHEINAKSNDGGHTKYWLEILDVFLLLWLLF